MMLRLTKEQWKLAVVSAIVSVFVGDGLRLILKTMWGADWPGVWVALKSPVLQVWIAQIAVPIIFTVLYFRRFKLRGSDHADAMGIIWLGGTAAGFFLVFGLNIGRQNNELVDLLRSEPYSFFMYYFAGAFFLVILLLHIVLTGIGANPRIQVANEEDDSG